jgi:cytochrome d ubiquinol oxidase subunit I
VRPPVAIVHISFQIMVGCGVAMMLVALWAAWRYLRGRHKQTWFDSKWFLRVIVVATPLGFIAIETGWTVTEVGRQPWIIYGVMRTSEAVTPMPGLVVPFITFTLLYIFLAAITVWLLLRQVAASPRDPDPVAKEARVAA